MKPLDFWESQRRISLSDEKTSVEIEELVDACRKNGDTQLDVGSYRLESLALLRDLDWLAEISCSGTRVSDLSPLASLPSLKELDCSGTFVSDLSPLEGLKTLQILDCAHAQVSDLSPLKALPSLKKIVCGSADLMDISPLSGITRLEELDCSYGRASDLTPLQSLAGLRDLNICHMPVKDLTPLEGFSALRMFDCSSSLVSDLAPLKGLAGLQILFWAGTQVKDLSPLSAMTGLRNIYFSNTQASDLSPLSALTDLKIMYCSHTQVSDLSPLSALVGLEEISCTETLVSDLSPITALTNLRSLDCANSQVSDLSPLKGLTSLRRLICYNTEVTDLTPLKGLMRLQNLSCNGTRVDDLSPLKDLKSLQSLSCAYTDVSDLSPLNGLKELQSLNFSHTGVSDLSPILGLKDLARLHCSGVRLTDWPRGLFDLPELRCFAHAAQIGQIPVEDLSEEPWVDCLPNIRSYFEDLDAGARPLERSKIIVLGNGQVGKTQLRRWLLNSPDNPQPFDPSIPSTHGIEVLRGPVAIPGADGTSSATIDASLWDFGGQDIYHGTHSLFMKTRAIFILCWCPQQEDNREQVLDGLVHRNRPMAYWLDYVRQLAGPDNPVIVVQTQCDSAADKQRRFSDLKLDGFESTEFLHFSASTGTGGAALRAAIGEAAKWTKARHGIPLIGKGRMDVLDRLEGWRSADSARPPAARAHKFLTQEDFKGLCEDAGGISSPPHLLNFLHHAGVVFHRPGMFEDRIILDQDGALQAIYALFNRKDCYRLIKRRDGRFTREMVAAVAWLDHGIDQQKLFLSMMTSCGIAFVHYRGGWDENATEYVAPELLPERAVLEERIESRWHGASEIVEERLRYPLLHHGLIRQILAWVGSEARISAEYWKTGVLFYERHRQSDAIIEAVEDETGWGGDIVISCRNGRAGELARLLADEVEKIGVSMGLTPERDPSAPASARTDTGKDEPALEFASQPSAKPKWYVSYAWGDDTAEGKERDAKVNALCDAARTRGIDIIRDRDTIGTGDSIRAFMGELVEGDRIIVILSGKYLHSPNCMFELYHAWIKRQANAKLFMQGVRPFRLPCAKISKPPERGKIAAHWRAEVDECAPYVLDLGPNDSRDYHLARQFALNVGEILYAINDTITPRDWDEFLDWAFGD